MSQLKQEQNSPKRLWFPLNDFNEEGYLSLPFLPFVADKVVLWAPTGKFFDAAQESDEKRFWMNKDMFRELALTEGGPFQICVREFWFNQEHPNHNQRERFRLNIWDKAFDPYFKDAFHKGMQYYNQTTDVQTINNLPIFVNPPDPGVEWATSVYESSDPDMKAKVKICEDLIDRPENLSPMFHQKMLQYKTSEYLSTHSTKEQRRDKVIRILRDSHNTLDSMNVTHCQTLRLLEDKTIGIMKRVYPEYVKENNIKPGDEFVLTPTLLSDFKAVVHILKLQRNIDQYAYALEASRKAPDDNDFAYLRYLLSNILFGDLKLSEKLKHNRSYFNKNIKDAVENTKELALMEEDEAYGSVLLTAAESEIDPGKKSGTFISPLKTSLARLNNEPEEVYLHDQILSNKEGIMQHLMTNPIIRFFFR